MKKKVLVIFILATVLLGFRNSKRQETHNPIVILHQMYDSIKAVKTLKLHINALERIDKTFFSEKSEIKLQVNPRKLYFINRKKKLEILYSQNENNGKAIVKSNMLPIFNLDPTGNMMRKNQHYTIHELGYDFIGKSIALTIAKDKEGIKNFTYIGKHKKFNYNCYVIQYENKNYNYVDYVVGEKETVSMIATKLVVNDYLLRYNNNLLNDFGYLKKGSRIIVPTLYCKKAVLFIHEKWMVPVAVSIYDGMGLFESYEYPLIELNPHLKSEEFTKNYPDYSF